MNVDVYRFPVPEVAGALGCTLIIFGAGLGLDAGWNALALFATGTVFAALAMVAQSVRVKRLEEES